MQGRLPSGGRLFLCSKIPGGVRWGALIEASGARQAVGESVEPRGTSCGNARESRRRPGRETAGGKCGRDAGRRERESRGEVKAKGAWRKTPVKGAGNARKAGETYGRSMRGYSGRRGLFPASPALCRAFSVFSSPEVVRREKAPAPFRRERKTRGLSLRA